MKIEKNLIKSYANLIRYKEHQNYTQKVNSITMFPYGNFMMLADFYKIILNFSLKEVTFNKKKALSFFLAVEYLTNQKCVATISSKNVLEWKLRKGALVGCKITLRKKNLFEFLDNLSLSLPRMEKFKDLQIKNFENIKSNTFGINLMELILFYPIELGLGINTEVKQLDINFVFSTFNSDEKIFLLTTYKIPVK